MELDTSTSPPVSLAVSPPLLLVSLLVSLVTLVLELTLSKSKSSSAWFLFSSSVRPSVSMAWSLPSSSRQREHAPQGINSCLLDEAGAECATIRKQGAPSLSALVKVMISWSFCYRSHPGMSVWAWEVSTGGGHHSAASRALTHTKTLNKKSDYHSSKLYFSLNLIINLFKSLIHS